MYGGLFGAAQGLVLGHYLKDASGSAIGIWRLWVLLTNAGWFVGWLVASPVRGLMNLAGVSEIARQVGAAAAELTGTQPIQAAFPSDPTVWVVVAASQGVTLAWLTAPAVGRRTLVPLAALWVLAGAVGGALGLVASFIIDSRVYPFDRPDLLLERILVHALSQGAIGAFYGAATGVVLAIVAYRTT